MKKVVIIGGGFAGSCIAKGLEKNFDVTLIDSKDFFEFTPGILRTIVEPQHIRKIQILHSHYLKRAKIIVGNVEEVRKNKVLVNGHLHKFDYLVICSGSRYNWPIKDQKTIMALRADNLREHSEKLLHAKKVLIIGGGLVGVELAGEILTKFKEKEVVIVHSRNRLINRNNVESSKIAEKFLRKKGARIIFNERVNKLKMPEWIKKERFGIIFICTGITPNFEFMKKHFKDKLEKKCIKVDRFLRLEGSKNIFVAGDVANIKEEKTAQNAEIHAKIIIKNIRAQEKSRKLKKYKSKKRPMVISLGKYNGIFEYKKMVISGLVPAAMKALIEWREMKKKKI